MSTDLHVLINRVLDGHASKAERQQLDAMLVGDPAARAEFEKMALGHNRLGMAFQALALPDDFANSIVDAHVRHQPSGATGVDIRADLPTPTPAHAPRRPVLHGVSPIVSRATSRRPKRVPTSSNTALTWIGGMMAAAGLLALITVLAVTNLPQEVDHRAAANAGGAESEINADNGTNADVPRIGANGSSGRPDANRAPNDNTGNGAPVNATENGATIEHHPFNNAGAASNNRENSSGNAAAGNNAADSNDASGPGATVDNGSGANSTNATGNTGAASDGNAADNNASPPNNNGGGNGGDSGVVEGPTDPQPRDPQPRDPDNDPDNDPDSNQTDPNTTPDPQQRALTVVVAKPDWQLRGSVTITAPGDSAERRVRARDWQSALAAFEEEGDSGETLEWVEGSAIETGSTGHVVIVEGALAIYMESDTTLRLVRDENTAREGYPGDLILLLEEGEIAVEARRPMLELPEPLRNALLRFDQDANLFGGRKDDDDDNERGPRGNAIEDEPLFDDAIRVRTEYADIAAVRAGFDLLYSVDHNSTGTTLKVFEGVAVLIELEDGAPNGVTLQVSSGENAYNLPIGGEADATRRGIDDRVAMIKPNLESWVREARTQRTSARLEALPFNAVSPRERDDLLRLLDDRFSEALRIGFDPNALVALIAFADSRSYGGTDMQTLADTLRAYTHNDVLRARHSPRAVIGWLFHLVQKGARGEELRECLEPHGEGEDPWREWGPR